MNPKYFLTLPSSHHPCCPAALNHSLCLLPHSAPINYPRCSPVIFLKCKSDPAAPLLKSLQNGPHARPPGSWGILPLPPHLSPLHLCPLPCGLTKWPVALEHSTLVAPWRKLCLFLRQPFPRPLPGSLLTHPQGSASGWPPPLLGDDPSLCSHHSRAPLCTSVLMGGGHGANVPP